MLFWIIIVFVLFDCASTTTINEKHSKSGCHLSNQKMAGMNPIVRTDRFGYSCRANITVPVCFGFCETSEVSGNCN